MTYNKPHKPKRKRKGCHMLRIFQCQWRKFDKKTRSNKLSQWPMSARRNQNAWQKKIAIEKTYEFVWNSVSIQEEEKVKKRGLPPEPRYAGICKFTTKIFQPPTPKGDRINFLYKDNQKPSEKRDPTNPFAVHLVNPFPFFSVPLQISYVEYYVFT